MKTIWRGRYLDGKTSISREASIRPLKSGLRIIFNSGVELVWPYSQIRQTQGRYAGEPVRLERGDELKEVLTIPDTDFLTALREKAETKAGRFHNPGFRRARVWWTAAAAVVTLGVCFSAYRWGIPALAKNVAVRVPVTWEEGLGQSTLDQLAPVSTRLNDPVLNRAIAKIMMKLIATVPECPYRFRVTVCNLPVVNAFALPGGNIVVFRGLLDETHSPEELAGVLAHETQHVLKRHTTQRLIQESSTGLLISAMAGDFTGSMAFGLKSASSLALLEYSRQEEEEADQEGMKMILAAGIDPQGMIRFFENLKKLDKVPKFLKYASTHPATEDRIQKLQALVSAQTGSTHTALAGKLAAPASETIQPEKLLPEIAWPSFVKGLKSYK